MCCGGTVPMMVQGVLCSSPRRNASACTQLTSAPQVLGCGCGEPAEPEVNTTAMRCLLSICGIANASAWLTPMTGYRSCGRSIVHRTLSVKQNTSGRSEEHTSELQS